MLFAAAVLFYQALALGAPMTRNGLWPSASSPERPGSPHSFG